MDRPEDLSYRLGVAAFGVLRATLAVAVLVGLLAGPVVVLGPGWSLWLGVFLFSIGVFALATARRLPLYPAHSFGIEHRVDEDTFDGGGKRCVECGDECTKGLRRRYARQFVIMGVPVRTLDWGSNEYCLRCAEPGGGPLATLNSSVRQIERDVEDAQRELDRAFDRS